MTPEGIPEGAFLGEAKRIVGAGEAEGIPLRLLGSVAIKIHSPSCARLYESVNRPLTDVDLVTYGKHNRRLRVFFAGLGYRQDESVARYFGESRHVYHSEGIEGLHVDVFFDRLSFCHEISFAGRLHLDPLTVSVTDLLLEKAQIVEINEKDLKDLGVLLCAHELGDHDGDVINTGYVAKLMSDDWGFTHTFTTNMQRLLQYVGDSDAFSGEEKQTVRTRASAIQAAVEAVPKSVRWRLRAKIGTRKRWYDEVEEITR
jgi:hypothetical protein